MEQEAVYQKFVGVKKKRRSYTLSETSTLKCLRFFEILILVPMVLIIAGLYSIPTFLYALRPDTEVRLIIQNMLINAWMHACRLL
jgi:ABC-type multidrug transport system permease subunit